MKYLLLPLLFLDCFLNVIVGSHRINETLSATAGRIQEKKGFFGWVATPIDWIVQFFTGQDEHCARSMRAEVQWSGAWGVWKSR